MKVLVLGGEGMLGHQVCRRLRSRFEVWASYRGDPRPWIRYGDVPLGHALGGVDAMAMSSVEAALAKAGPDAVVNCIGIVKQRAEAAVAVPSIVVNSLFPHALAERCESVGARLLNVSTDCVFSGRSGSYTEDELPDPPDLYGRSKLLGELDRPGCLTLRTSIVGWEVGEFASLLEWFAAQRGRTIPGYNRARYTGLSTIALADVMAWVLEEWPGLSGLYHVAGDVITKHDLLVRLRDRLDWQDITIEPDEAHVSDMSLVSSRFRKDTGWQPPSWQSMIDGLAAAWPLYASWRGGT